MKRLNRRAFLAMGTLLPLLSFKKATPKAMKNQQVVHHVFFWLKNPDSVEDKLKLKEGLKTLESIREVKKLLIGEPASTLKRDVVVNDWQVTEIMYFDSIEDQDTYQTHPTHQAFVEQYSHLWDRVVVYDTLVD
jgi:hypothetical protein